MPSVTCRRHAPILNAPSTRRRPTLTGWSLKRVDALRRSRKPPKLTSSRLSPKRPVRRPVFSKSLSNTRRHPTSRANACISKQWSAYSAVPTRSSWIQAAAASNVVPYLPLNELTRQTQQALVVRLGEPRPPVPDPGLHVKAPFIDSVVYIDKRILDLEAPPQEVIASDQKRLVVDAFARYRIKDPLRFYQTLGSINGANSQLSILLNSALRRVLGEVTFTHVVRDQRADLMARIRELVDHEATGFGIEVVDVRIRRADLPEQNSQAVYQRMQTERQREAAEFRAQGAQRAQEIRSRADREVTVLVADATSKSEQIRGEGDATRNQIFADAFNQDPDFFAFYRSMQAYESSLKAGDTRLLLKPDTNFFRYFNDPSGKLAAPAPAAATPSASAPK